MAVLTRYRVVIVDGVAQVEAREMRQRGGCYSPHLVAARKWTSAVYPIGESPAEAIRLAEAQIDDTCNHLSHRLSEARAAFESAEREAQSLLRLMMHGGGDA